MCERLREVRKVQIILLIDFLFFFRKLSAPVVKHPVPARGTLPEHSLGITALGSGIARRTYIVHS
jgi:hypothetical protein